MILSYSFRYMIKQQKRFNLPSRQREKGCLSMDSVDSKILYLKTQCKLK